MKPDYYKFALVSMLATICALLCIILWAVLTKKPRDTAVQRSRLDAQSESTDWDQAFRMLSIAEDMPPHERGLWILATNFAKDGYVFDDDTPIGMNFDDIRRANSKEELHPPDRRNITWTIAGTRVWSDGPSGLQNEKKNAGYEALFWDELASEWLQSSSKTGGLNIYPVGGEMIMWAGIMHEDRAKAGELCRRLLTSKGYTHASVSSVGKDWWSLTLRKSENGYDYQLHVDEVTEAGATELTAEHTFALIVFSRSK